MGRYEAGEIGGICGYAKTRYEARVEERRRKRLHNEGKDKMTTLEPRKLHKPPQVQTLHERPPRNRLRKQSKSLLAAQDVEQKKNHNLFILEFDPYPYDTQTRTYLGAYSTINHVTAGAFKHGACAFSKEGLLDGSEYLSPTGRIKILSLPIIRTGSKVTIPERSKESNGEVVRLDIPHPESQTEVVTSESAIETSVAKGDANVMVFLAIRQGASNASCIGVYSEKSLAWSACLKDKAMCAQIFSLSDEVKNIGVKNMPSVTSILVGSGRYTWLVEGHIIDSTSKK